MLQKTVELNKTANTKTHAKLMLLRQEEATTCFSFTLYTAEAFNYTLTHTGNVH